MGVGRNEEVPPHVEEQVALLDLLPQVGGHGEGRSPRDHLRPRHVELVAALARIGSTPWSKLVGNDLDDGHVLDLVLVPEESKDEQWPPFLEDEGDALVGVFADPALPMRPFNHLAEHALVFEEGRVR